MEIKRILALHSCFLLCLTSFGQVNKLAAVENSLKEVREFIFEDSIYRTYNIADRMKFYKVPSVSISVINDGKIEWTRTYGFADVANGRKPDVHTLYQVASISKSVNGYGIMRLVQQGKLSLIQDIRSYLKTWPFPENEFSQAKPITLKNLLSHTAGLSVHGFIGYSSSDTIPTINQILNGERPANNKPVRPIYVPGEHFEYSGGGSMVVMKIIEDNISGNYDSIMQALVLGPLGMTNSTFSQPLSSRYRNYAYGYDKDMKVLKGNYYIYPEQAAGGLWSTSADIAKFVVAIQKDLKGDPKAIVNKPLADEMLTPVLDNYALGFGIVEKGGGKYFWHEGESYGYNSIYYGSFTTGKGAVILTNAFPSNGHPFIQELLNSVAIVYDWKGFYNPIRKKIAYVPDSVLDNYVGVYYCENPQLTISITRKGHELELTARRPEKMYATKIDTFFLASSPNDTCFFSSSKDDGHVDIFEVIQDGKSIIRAVKNDR